MLYQEYLNAALMLATMRAPLNSGNPYFSLKSETGFITFGMPMLQVLVAEVIARAIKNAWFQKWFVHRMARPEETAGLVHYTKTAGREFLPRQQRIKFAGGRDGIQPHRQLFHPAVVSRGVPAASVVSFGTCHRRRRGGNRSEMVLR